MDILFGLIEANQKTGVESTTPKVSLCQSVGVTNEGVQGDVINQSIDVDVAKNVTSQVQRPIAVSNVQDQVISVDAIEAATRQVLMYRTR